MHGYVRGRVVGVFEMNADMAAFNRAVASAVRDAVCEHPLPGRRPAPSGVADDIAAVVACRVYPVMVATASRWAQKWEDKSSGQEEGEAALARAAGR